jgi:hypothetical protein
MSLPAYFHIHLKSAQLDEIQAVLSADLNLKSPVVFNLKHLDFDEQREVIGLIENFFTANDISFKYPYPVYILSQHESSLSQITIIRELKNLPRFFTQKDGRVNVRESELVAKNKLLQLEVKNIDALGSENNLKNFSESHKIIYSLEKERTFYRHILNKIQAKEDHG